MNPLYKSYNFNKVENKLETGNVIKNGKRRLK